MKRAQVDQLPPAALQPTLKRGKLQINSDNPAVFRTTKTRTDLHSELQLEERVAGRAVVRATDAVCEGC